MGVFNTHQSKIKDDNALLYYQSHTINKEETEIKLIVNQVPKYISIDPFGTRSDENVVDNTFRF